MSVFGPRGSSSDTACRARQDKNTKTYAHLTPCACRNQSARPNRIRPLHIPRHRWLPLAAAAGGRWWPLAVAGRRWLPLAAVHPLYHAK
eukprot:4511952-Prymnesium_polylepis.2